MIHESPDVVFSEVLLALEVVNSFDSWPCDSHTLFPCQIRKVVIIVFISDTVFEKLFKLLLPVIVGIVVNYSLEFVLRVWVVVIAELDRYRCTGSAAACREQTFIAYESAS